MKRKSTPLTSSKTSATATTNVKTNTTPVTTSLGAPKTGASITQTFTPSINGLTLTFDYASSGQQHLMKGLPDNTIFANSTPISRSIDFGDGTSGSGGDTGLAECMPNSALAPFSDSDKGETHTYAKPGTYTVKTIVTICGDSGVETKTQNYTVTIK